MKTYLSYTAIIEGLTGLGLVFFPMMVSKILLQTELDNSLAQVFAMIGGAAIFSIAWFTWMVKSDVYPFNLLKILLLYNAAVAFILLFAFLHLKIGGSVLWVVIIFHFVQAIISIILIRKNTTK